MKAKQLSPALFGFALLSFFLPFVSVSCQQQKIATLTGIQVTFGATLDQGQGFGPQARQKVDPEPLAILAFLAGIAGLAIGLLKNAKGGIVAAVLAGIGAIALLLLKSKFDTQILTQSRGFVHPDYEIGFWLISISYLAAAAINILLLLSQDKTVREAGHEPLSP